MLITGLLWLVVALLLLRGVPFRLRYGPILATPQGNPALYGLLAILFMLALLAVTWPDLARWSKKVVPPTASACRVATDAAYGFDPAKPIPIGGGSVAGVIRTRQYLGNLRGPGGELVDYYWQENQVVGGAILHVYSLGHPDGQRRELYVDYAQFYALQAPIGYICDAPFGILAPSSGPTRHAADAASRRGYWCQGDKLAE